MERTHNYKMYITTCGDNLYAHAVTEKECVFIVIGFFYNKYVFYTDLIFCLVTTEIKRTNRTLSCVVSLQPSSTGTHLFCAFCGPSVGASITPRNYQGGLGLCLRVVLLPSTASSLWRSNRLAVSSRSASVLWTPLSEQYAWPIPLPRTRTVLVSWHIRRFHLCPKYKLYL